LNLITIKKGASVCYYLQVQWYSYDDENEKKDKEFSTGRFFSKPESQLAGSLSKALSSYLMIYLIHL